MQVQTLSSDAARCGQNEVMWKDTRYRDGKMEETAYYRGDTVEISDSAIVQMKIPQGSENYNSIKGGLKNTPVFPHNRMFHETMDVMRDYYSGKIGREEVREIYKTYCRSVFGQPDPSRGPAWKEKITQGLSELYEFFSRANTRMTNAQNLEEGKAVGREAGAGGGVAYYNSKYYFACQEMQDLFRCVSDEVAGEYGAGKVDFAYVEEHTMFRLDGGITYNGVWDYLNENTCRLGGSRVMEMKDQSMVPPRNFIYFSCSLSEKFHSEKLNKCISSLNGIRNFLAQNTMTLTDSHGGRKSLLADVLGKDKDALLYKGWDFVNSLSFTYAMERAEACSIGE